MCTISLISAELYYIYTYIQRKDLKCFTKKKQNEMLINKSEIK